MNFTFDGVMASATAKEIFVSRKNFPFGPLFFQQFVCGTVDKTFIHADLFMQAFLKTSNAKTARDWVLIVAPEMAVKAAEDRPSRPFELPALDFFTAVVKMKAEYARELPSDSDKFLVWFFSWYSKLVVETQESLEIKGALDLLKMKNGGSRSLPVYYTHTGWKRIST